MEQKDSDGDGVNDAEDAFPDNASIDSDRDNDGVADEFDAYPDDALRSEFEEESSNSGLFITIAVLLVIGILAAVLVVGRNGNDIEESFAQTQENIDLQSEAFAAQEEPSKDLPNLEESAQVQPQQWEENGVHWSQAADGTLSYWDESAQKWEVYNQ